MSKETKCGTLENVKMAYYGEWGFCGVMRESREIAGGLKSATSKSANHVLARSKGGWRHRGKTRRGFRRKRSKRERTQRRRHKRKRW